MSCKPSANRKRLHTPRDEKSGTYQWIDGAPFGIKSPTLILLKSRCNSCAPVTVMRREKKTVRGAILARINRG
jgi:hypothetical protein